MAPLLPCFGATTICGVYRIPQPQQIGGYTLAALATLLGAWHNTRINIPYCGNPLGNRVSYRQSIPVYTKGITMSIGYYSTITISSYLHD